MRNEKSALGMFSPYNPDYGRNAGLLAFAATMLQNAGRQPFGQGAPMSTAQALGSGALAGLGAYGQAEQQQYARTKPNYQVINDQLVSITPPTERGGQPTIKTIQDLRTPTVKSAPTIKDIYDKRTDSMVSHQWDGEKWIPIGDPRRVGERQHLIRNGVYVYDHFEVGDQRYAETSPQWVMSEDNKQYYRIPQTGDKKLQSDTTKWTTPTRVIEVDPRDNRVGEEHIVYNKKDMTRHRIDPATGIVEEEPFKLKEGHKFREVGTMRATEDVAGDAFGEVSQDAINMETGIDNIIALHTEMRTKFNTEEGRASLGMTGGFAQFIDTTAAQFKNVSTLLKARRLDPADEKERADSLEKYLTNGQIDLSKVEQDSEIAFSLDKAVNTGFIKGIAVDAAKKKSMILNLAYQMAAAENDGRPSDKDVKSAIQRLGGSAGSHAQLLGAIEGTIQTSHNNYKNYLTNVMRWNPALKDRINIRGLDTSIDEGGFGFVPQGTTPTSRTQTTPLETFSPEQLRANPNLEERQTVNGTIYYVPKRQ